MSTPATAVGSSLESAYAWTRLGAALVLSAIGNVGMWSVIVALPAVQAEFGVARSAAALPYTVTMISFGLGGIVMGRLSDRLGIMVPVVGGALSLGLGYVAASQATSLWQFVLTQGLLVGVAGSATFAPIIADISCCVAMSMPQVHIVAYSGALGHGAASGAKMLSLMLGFGIVSRLASGWICDRIGGRRTLLLGSSLQALALVLFLPFDGLASLYILSALFGLSQGGITPAYAVIIREFYPPEEAGVRGRTVLIVTPFGMALGGWMSGVIFDLTGSYQAAFVNGILWNLLNIGIAVVLLRQPR